MKHESPIANVRTDDLFMCRACREFFSEPVWHCPGCAHHWPMPRDDCWNCHAFTREEGIETSTVSVS